LKYSYGGGRGLGRLIVALLPTRKMKEKEAGKYGIIVEDQL
jgi:hypothetical protein